MTDALDFDDFQANITTELADRFKGNSTRLEGSQICMRDMSGILIKHFDPMY